MNPYACTGLGTLAELGGHAVTVRLIAPFPGQKPPAELALEGVPRTAFEVSRDRLANADFGTVRQLENRIAGLPPARRAHRRADRRSRGRDRRGRDMLDRPFKHEEALVAARAEAERVEAAIAARTGGNQDPAEESDPELAELARLRAASFPARAGSTKGTSDDGAKAYQPTEQRDVSRARQPPPREPVW